MNEYVIAGEKLYPVKEKIIKSKTGKEYSSKHVKITVATDYYSGKQIQHDYTGKNNNEVQNKINESTCLNDEQLNLITHDINIEQLIDEYLNYKTGQVTDERINYLQKFSRRYIIPKIGKTLINDLKREDIINIQNNIKQEFNNKNSVSTCFYLMKNALDYACKAGYISCNPCKYAQAYEKVKYEQPILNSDQIRKLLVTEKEHVYSGIYAVILFLALRFGEALGLSWEQIDWENRTITISQQLKEGNKLKKSTKTKVDHTITAPKCVFYYLERQKDIQAFWKEFNPKWNNVYNLVFTDKNGDPCDRGSVARCFKKIMKDTSNPAVTLHSLRRTTATILAENVSMLASQYYLGHVSRSSTGNYIYPSSKNTDQLINIMSEHFEQTFYASGLDKIYPPCEGGLESSN